MNSVGKSDDGATTIPIEMIREKSLVSSIIKTKMENPIGKAMALQNSINNGI